MSTQTLDNMPIKPIIEYVIEDGIRLRKETIKIGDDIETHRYYLGDTDIIHRDPNIGPAVIFKNGEKYWIKNGHFHNENGPSVIKADGSEIYYIDNKKLDYEDFILKSRSSKVEDLKKILDNLF